MEGGECNIFVSVSVGNSYQRLYHACVFRQRLLSNMLTSVEVKACGIFVIGQNEYETFSNGCDGLKIEIYF